MARNDNLRRHLEQARLDAGWYWVDLAKRAHVTYATLANVMNGRPYKPETARGVEDAVGWTRGSFEQVVQGKAPTPRATHRRRREARRREDQLRRDRLIEAISTVPEDRLDDIEALVRFIEAQSGQQGN